MISLARIVVYPIKGLDGVSLEMCPVLETGPLEFDRRYRMVDHEGRVINGKRTAAVHGIRAGYDLMAGTVTLAGASADPVVFSLVEDRQLIEAWLSNHFGFAVRMEGDQTHGFPDDPDSPGPTLVSTATLRQIASWYPGLTTDEVRRRFRPNLEIDAPEPFWEDRLVTAGENRFHVGGTTWRGVRICQRCVVPSRDARSGEVTPGFQKRFAELRAQSRPASSPVEAFDHFYRVCINTRPEHCVQARSLQVGDPLSREPGEEQFEVGGGERGES